MEIFLFLPPYIGRVLPHPPACKNGKNGDKNGITKQTFVKIFDKKNALLKVVK